MPRRFAILVFIAPDKCVVGGVLIRKQRIAAHRRNDMAVEQRAGRRRIEKTPVRMPRLRKHRRGFVGLATHFDYARMSRDRRNIGIIAIRPQGRGEALQIGDFELLVANADDLVLEPGGANCLDVGVRQWLGQVDVM